MDALIYGATAISSCNTSTCAFGGFNFNANVTPALFIGLIDGRDPCRVLGGYLD